MKPSRIIDFAANYFDFSFYSRKYSDVPLSHSDGLSINSIINDNAKHYNNEILSNSWTHSPEQLRLMVEYPISNLGVA